MTVDFIEPFIASAIGTSSWVWRNIMFDVPWQENYFWGLTFISLVVWAFELMTPWRASQRRFRHDFWLDAAYMYVNFFVFSIVISGFYVLTENAFASIGINHDSFVLIDISQWPNWLQLLTFFVVLDLFQWFTHKLLHRVPCLWRFHQVHHSIKEMGFAGHLRYHPMENLFYKPMKTLAVMLLGGFEPSQAFMVHFFTITIGHLNHANIKLDYGVLRYVFNNPVMHLYHHAYHLPKQHRYGVNFGISLSVWDFIFGSAYIPEQSGNVAIGYVGDKHLPASFWGQLKHGFIKPVTKE